MTFAPKFGKVAKTCGRLSDDSRRGTRGYYLVRADFFALGRKTKARKMDDIRALQEQRGRAVDQMRKVADEANAQEGGWTSEQRQKFERLDTDQQALKTRIDDAGKVEHVRHLSEDIEELVDRGNFAQKKVDGFNYREQCQAFAAHIRGDQLTDRESAALKAGSQGFGRDGKFRVSLLTEAPKSLEELRQQVREINMRATTPQSTTTNAAGGFLVDTILRARLEERLLAIGSARAYSTVIRTARGGTLNIPGVDDTAQVAAIVAENSTATVADVKFTNKALGDFMYRSAVWASKEVIQDSVIDLPSYIGGALGTRLARGSNAHFTTGSTTGGTPRGIRTEAGTGVSTSSNTILDATTNTAYDNLVQVLHSVDPAYRSDPSCGWIMHDDILQKIRRVRDTDGRPIWNETMRSGTPDRLLGYPIFINQDMTTSTTVNSSWLLFGKLDAYVIRDVMDLEIMVNRERRSMAGQVEFLSFSRHDGRTVFGATTNDVIKGLVGTT